MRITPYVLLAGLATAAGAEETPPPRLEVHGFVDTLFAYNTSRPHDHANFFAGVGTTARPENEATVNLAVVELSRAAAPVGFKLALGFGNAADVVHAGEVDGPGTGPDTWRHVVQASVQWQTGLGRGLALEAGIYPCHAGMEGFAARDNWNHTRSWLGDLLPYYVAGVKASLPFDDHWSGQLHVVNGWQTIGDVNRGKTLGAQVAYAGEKLSVSLNGLVGPELRDQDEVRALGDLVATLKVTPALALGLSADLAREGRAEGDDAGWKGIGVYARLAPPDARTSIALRAETFDDGDGAISGTAQTLREVTATLEHRPHGSLLLRLEGRYDRSTAEVFSGPEPQDPRRRQLLVLLAAVASF